MRSSRILVAEYSRRVATGEQGIATERRRYCAGDQHRRHWRLGKIGCAGMPGVAKIVTLMKQLEYRSNQWKFVIPFDEGIFNHLPDALGERSYRKMREVRHA